MDLELPYLLKAYNICHFENSHFYIGDRKTYPQKKDFFVCNNCSEIALALKNMITQGGGPLQVALTAFRYIANEMKRGVIDFSFKELKREITFIVEARVTNTTMKRCVEKILQYIEIKFDTNNYFIDDFVKDINDKVDEIESDFNETYLKMAQFGSSLIKNNDSILTTCFAEHTFLLSLLLAKKEGKKIKVYVNETRPYFQGTRLTAPSLKELGIDVTIVSDAMGSFLMREKLVTKYMTAADLVCMDGSVVNKIGTNQNAICAKYYNIDYIVFSMSPDTTKSSFNDVDMEYRNPDELLKFNNKYIGDENISALYPAFDIIESNLITSIVTDKGIFKPKKIKEYV